MWLKDDGAFGAGPWGGNKVRKLEWLIPDAHRRGARVILTVGGLGTNWGLATALYGAEHGLRTVLALVDQPVDEHVERQLERLRASGAELHFTHTKARTVALLPWLMLRHSGRRPPCILPAGGSTPVGVLGLRGGRPRDRRPGGGGRAAGAVPRGGGHGHGGHGRRADPRAAARRPRHPCGGRARERRAEAGRADHRPSRGAGRAAAAPAGRRVPRARPTAGRAHRARRMDRPRVRPPHAGGLGRDRGRAKPTRSRSTRCTRRRRWRR